MANKKDKTNFYRIASVVRTDVKKNRRQEITEDFKQGTKPSTSYVKLQDFIDLVKSLPASTWTTNGLKYGVTFDVIGSIKAEKHGGYVSQGNWFRKLGGDFSYLAALMDEIQQTELAEFFVAFTGDFIIYRVAFFDIIIKTVILGTADGSIMAPQDGFFTIKDDKCSIEADYVLEGDACCFIKARQKDDSIKLFKPAHLVQREDKYFLLDSLGNEMCVEPFSAGQLFNGVKFIICADDHVYDDTLRYYNINSSRFIALFRYVMSKDLALKQVDHFDCKEPGPDAIKSLRYINNASQVTVYAITKPCEESVDISGIQAFQLQDQNFRDDWLEFFTGVDSQDNLEEPVEEEGSVSEDNSDAPKETENE